MTNLPRSRSHWRMDRPQGRGKRGGARVIYYYFTGRSEIALLLVYAKNEADDLTSEQKRLPEEIVGQWR